MKIGVIGLGIVGSTVKTGMEKLGYDVISHDIKHETSIEDVRETELCYICVPTPSTESGKCDISIVESVVEEIKSNGLCWSYCYKIYRYTWNYR